MVDLVGVESYASGSSFFKFQKLFLMFLYSLEFCFLICWGCPLLFVSIGTIQILYRKKGKKKRKVLSRWVRQNFEIFYNEDPLQRLTVYDYFFFLIHTCCRMSRYQIWVWFRSTGVPEHGMEALPIKES